MGNKHYQLDITKVFSSLMDFQKKDILSSCIDKFKLKSTIVTKEEIHLIYLLFINLKSRSFVDGIDKDSFNHFCDMPVSPTDFMLIVCLGTMGYAVFLESYVCLKERVHFF